MRVIHNIAAMAAGVATGSAVAIITNKICDETDMDPCSNLSISITAGTVVGTATGAAILTTLQTREMIDAQYQK